MELIQFVKDKWNAVLQIALITVLLISKFTIPPQFDNDLLESQVDFISFSKFLVAALLLIVLVPAQFYKQRKHIWFWWLTALAFLIVGIYYYFQYNDKVNTYTVFDKDAKSRVVIGNTLLPAAKDNLSLYSKKHGGDVLLPAEWIEGLGGPEKVWPKDEIRAHAKQIVLNYIITILCLSAFIVSGIQAVYITSLKAPLN